MIVNIKGIRMPLEVGAEALLTKVSEILSLPREAISSLLVLG